MTTRIGMVILIKEGAEHEEEEEEVRAGYSPVRFKVPKRLHFEKDGK